MDFLCFSLHNHVSLTPKASSCWFIQVVAVASSVSIARSTPVLASSSSCLDFSFNENSPNGEIIAVGDSSGLVYLWQIATTKLLATFEGHTSWVWCVAFSPDANRLASSGNDTSIRLWDVQRNVLFLTLTIKPLHPTQLSFWYKGYRKRSPAYILSLISSISPNSSSIARTVSYLSLEIICPVESSLGYPILDKFPPFL